MILYIISGFTGNGIWASEMFSVSFMGIDGLEMMHTGQFILFLMSLSAFLTMILAWVTVFRTKSNPHPTQTEEVVIPVFLTQIFSLMFFTTLMYILSNLGDDPS